MFAVPRAVFSLGQGFQWGEFCLKGYVITQLSRGLGSENILKCGHFRLNLTDAKINGENNPFVFSSYFSNKMTIFSIVFSMVCWFFYVNTHVKLRIFPSFDYQNCNATHFSHVYSKISALLFYYLS